MLIMPKFYNGAEESSIIIRDEMNIKILVFEYSAYINE